MGDGYEIEVPERLADEFRRRFAGGPETGALPAIPYRDFASVLSSYAFAKAQPEPTAAAIRDDLDAIAERAWAFASYIREIGLDAADQISAQSAMRGYGGRDLAQELIALANAFGGCAEMARRTAESGVTDGRPVGPETRLVRGLARLITAHGGEVNAKENGALCTAYGIAAEIAVEAGLKLRVPKDVRATVRAAIDGWE